MIDDLRYKHAIIYSLDVQTFMDSNQDGIGDFEGRHCIELDPVGYRWYRLGGLVDIQARTPR